MQSQKVAIRPCTVQTEIDFEIGILHRREGDSNFSIKSCFEYLLAKKHHIWIDLLVGAFLPQHYAYLSITAVV